MKAMQTPTYDRLQYLLNRIRALSGGTYHLSGSGQTWSLLRVDGNREHSVLGNLPVRPAELAHLMMLYIKGIEVGRRAVGTPALPDAEPD